MGGGDLNMKKSWHPLLMKNQERVWLEEQKAFTEKKKLDQLRKELEEERQLQELQRLQEEQTGKKRVEKLDWMYATPATGGGPSANDLEEYLLGKKRVDKMLIGNENEKVGAAHKNFIAVQNANTARDTAAKIREDPMFAIKSQEQAALQALLTNPLRLKAMKEKAGIKDEKKEKREKKKHKHRHRDHDRERDDIERSPSRRSRHHVQSRSRSRSPMHMHDSRRSRSPSPRRHDRYSDYPRRDKYGDDSRSSREHRMPHRSRSRTPQERSRSRERYRGDDRYPRSNHNRDHTDRDNSHSYSRQSEHQSSSDHYSISNRAPTKSAEEIAAERTARLAAMSDNASSLETARQGRLAAMEAAHQAEVEAEEAARRKAGKGSKGSFMRDQEKMVYGVGNSMGLEERLKRGRGGLVRESD